MADNAGLFPNLQPLLSSSWRHLQTLQWLENQGIMGLPLSLQDEKKEKPKLAERTTTTYVYNVHVIVQYRQDA